MPIYDPLEPDTPTRTDQKKIFDPLEPPTMQPGTPQTLRQKIGSTMVKAGESAENVRNWAIQNIPVASNIRPMAEVGGATAGGILGTPVVGTGLGYLGGKYLADYLEELAGTKQPETMGEKLKGAVTQDIPEAAITGMAGPLLGGVEKAKGVLVKAGDVELKGVIPWTAEKLGKVIKPLFGRLTGAGTGAAEETVKSGKTLGETQFDKALSGKISGEEVVNNAKEALNVIKDQRSVAYRKQLELLPQQTIDKKPITDEVESLVERFGYRFNKQQDITPVPNMPGFGYSKLTKQIEPMQISKDIIEPVYTSGGLGKAAEKDIKDIVTTVTKWGEKEGDLTPKGLDTLKKSLDDFYSESSKARAFVAQLRRKVSDTISEQVPQYKEMTKGYSEATNLIQEIEQGLSLRKTGMTGRVTADQTLRRLMSSMRDNFELRRDLVNTLGAKAGEDLSGQIAGYTMKGFMPIGLAGTGPAIAAEIALAKFVDPHFWPLIAASSPRVAAEFLRTFGKASSELKMAGAITRPAMGRAVAQNPPDIVKEAGAAELPKKGNKEPFNPPRIDRAALKNRVGELKKELSRSRKQLSELSD